MKTNCINGSIVNGVQEPISYSSALSSPPCHKIYNQPKIKLSKKIKKSVLSLLSHIMFFFEDEDNKLVDFIGETKSFTRQLIKIK